MRHHIYSIYLLFCNNKDLCNVVSFPSNYDQKYISALFSWFCLLLANKYFYKWTMFAQFKLSICIEFPFQNLKKTIRTQNTVYFFCIYKKIYTHHIRSFYLYNKSNPSRSLTEILKMSYNKRTTVKWPHSRYTWTNLFVSLKMWILIFKIDNRSIFLLFHSRLLWSSQWIIQTSGYSIVHTSP